MVFRSNAKLWFIILFEYYESHLDAGELEKARHDCYMFYGEIYQFDPGSILHSCQRLDFLLDP